MKKNLGAVDRVVRIVVAALLVVLYATNAISGVAAIVLAVLAVVFLMTSLVGFCPLYWPLKLSTLGKAKR